MAATRKVSGGAIFFPSCSFLLFVSSLLLSFPFLSLFYFLLFPSSFSPFCLYFSLCLRPLFLNNHPHVSSLLGLPLFFYLLCFLLCISSFLFQTIPSTFSLRLSLPFVLSLSGPLKKTLQCPLKNSLANRTPPFCSPHSGIY